MNTLQNAIAYLEEYVELLEEKLEQMNIYTDTNNGANEEANGIAMAIHQIKETIINLKEAKNLK